MQVTSSYVSVESKGGLDFLRVKHPLAEACIALQGAQVLEYAPTGARPVIWLSEEAAFLKGQAVRGGVPVCWPWFGDLRRNPEPVKSQYCLAEPPAHGWARTVEWQVDSIIDAPDSVTITLSVPEAVFALASASMAVRPRLQVSVGERLRLDLINAFPRELALMPSPVTTKNRVAIAQALHTYFAVSDIDNVVVEGLVGVPFLDALKDCQALTEVGPVRLHEETDRIYQGAVADVCLRDEGWDRCIRLRSVNSNSLVLWNPHIEKSLRLNQFAPDAWRRMVCIETANIMSDMVVLTPGECHVLQVEIAVESF